MEELNKEVLNEEAAEETVEEVSQEAEYATQEVVEEVSFDGADQCCCAAPKKKKISISAIVTWVASLITLYFGISSAVDFAKEIAEVKAQAVQAGGTLESLGITTSQIISIIGTSIVPMFVYTIILYGIGRILWVQKNK